MIMLGRERKGEESGKMMNKKELMEKKSVSEVSEKDGKPTKKYVIGLPVP